MKNAEAAISCRKGGVNSLRTGGGVDILGLAGYRVFFRGVGAGSTSFFWGDQHPVT